MELFTWTISAPNEEHVVFCRKEDGVYTLTADSRVVGVYRRSRPDNVTRVNEPVTLYGRPCRFVVWQGVDPRPDLIVDGQSLEKGMSFQKAWMAARLRSITMAFVVLAGVLALIWLWNNISRPIAQEKLRWFLVGDGGLSAAAAVIVVWHLWRIKRERITLFGPKR